MKPELWLSRDDDEAGCYNIYQKESRLSTGGAGPFYSFITCFAFEEFHNLFLVRLHRGQKKRIKRILIELED